jgi:hypothetical protein
LAREDVIFLEAIPAFRYKLVCKNCFFGSSRLLSGLPLVALVQQEKISFCGTRLSASIGAEGFLQIRILIVINSNRLKVF